MEKSKKKTVLITIIIILVLVLVLAGLVAYFIFGKKEIKGYYCEHYSCYEGRKNAHKNLKAVGNTDNRAVITDGNKILFFNTETKEVEDVLYECKTDDCEWLFLYVCDDDYCNEYNHTRMVVYDGEMIYYDHVSKEKSVLPLKYEDVISDCDGQKCGVIQPLGDNMFLYSKEAGAKSDYGRHYLINGYKFDQHDYTFLMEEDGYVVLTREHGIRDVVEIATGKVVHTCEDPDYCHFESPDGNTNFTLTTVKD